MKPNDKISQLHYNKIQTNVTFYFTLEKEKGIFVGYQVVRTLLLGKVISWKVSPDDIINEENKK